MINNKRRIQKLRTQPPWWNKECTRLKNMKYNNLKQFRQTNDTSDLERYKLAKTSFKNQCKREKLEYQKNCRRKLIESRKEPKQFWSYIRNTENIDIHVLGVWKSQNDRNCIRNWLDLAYMPIFDSILINLAWKQRNTNNYYENHRAFPKLIWITNHVGQHPAYPGIWTINAPQTPEAKASNGFLVAPGVEYTLY